MADKLLLIEDDEEIIKYLRLLLSEEGFLVHMAENGQKAWKKIEENSYDLILLDLGLPDRNGYALCAEIKQKMEVPLIMLTAMDDEASIVTGFHVGADDYITKPFKPLELISRIKNILRLHGRKENVVTVGEIKIDMRKAMVMKEGKEIMLSALEYKLLLVFVHHRGEIISRERLLEEIWDIAGEFVNDNTLTVYIKRLRQKIEKDPTRPELIQTCRGLGYRMGE